VLFETSSVENDCEADENDCYIDTLCTLGNQSTPGTGKTSQGTDENLTADCQVTVYFNANSGDWDVNAKATDDNGETTFADAGVTLTIPALTGINVVESEIAYGGIAIGGTSPVKEISLGNVGNQQMDMLVEGGDMCIGTYEATCSGDYIPQSAQRWHHSEDDFDWDESATGDGPYPLTKTADTTGGNTGCINHSIRKRDDRTSTTESNQSIFWKLRIPEGQPAGTYYGQITLATTTQCVPEVCDQAGDEDGDGRENCADHHDCDFHPDCMELSLRMIQSDHDSGNNRTLDQSHNSLHATFGDGVTSSTFPTKLFRPAYLFDGTDDYMNVGNNAALDQTGDFTIMLWYNTLTYGSGSFPGLLSKRDTYEGMDWELYYDNGQNQLEFAYGPSAANVLFDTLGANPPTGKWHHVAVTRQGDTFTLWVDGISQGTEDSSAAMPTGDSVRIGVLGADGDYFNGKISDVKMFDYAMNGKQIRHLFLELLSLWK
jgi:hypothetical protein